MTVSLSASSIIGYICASIFITISATLNNGLDFFHNVSNLYPSIVAFSSTIGWFFVLFCFTSLPTQFLFPCQVNIVKYSKEIKSNSICDICRFLRGKSKVRLTVGRTRDDDV